MSPSRNPYTARRAVPSKMKCPRCGYRWVRVLESRDVDPAPMRPNHVRRRRECDTCGYRFTTREFAEAAA
jgi:transcriptional repressor NrdR